MVNKTEDWSLLNLGIYNHGIFIPGDWGFSKIWGFLSRGLGTSITVNRGFLKNLRIFVKSLGFISRELKIFYPRDFFGNFLFPGFFGNWVFFRGMGYLTKKPPLVNKTFIFLPRKWSRVKIRFLKTNIAVALDWTDLRNVLEIPLLWQIQQWSFDNVKMNYSGQLLQSSLSYSLSKLSL